VLPWIKRKAKVKVNICPPTDGISQCFNSHLIHEFRYFVRVVISRRLGDIVREKDIWVYSYRALPDQNHPLKMEVGIEECLHIEFEYNKSRYVS
jgi:hypothetical protein